MLRIQNIKKLQLLSNQRQLFKQIRIQPQTNIKQQYLQFDQENYCLVYEDKNGIDDMKWAVRISLSFTLLNSFLFITEATSPVFGGWNYFSFSSSLLLGMGMMTGLNVFSKRTIHKLKVNRKGDRVQITFLNAFWEPQVLEVAQIIRSQFKNLRISSLHFITFIDLNQQCMVKFGLTLRGIILQAQRNSKVCVQIDILSQVLSGQEVQFGKYHQAADKYKKYKNL